MPKAICGSCHGAEDARSMELCPDCEEYICVACAEDGGTVCPSCFTERVSRPKIP